MSQLGNFRHSFSIPKDLKVQWFPGHMQKGISQVVARLRNLDCVLEIHDARIPFSGRNPLFEGILKMKPHLLLLNKCDLADLTHKKEIVNRFKNEGVDQVLFTDLGDRNSKVIKTKLFPAVVEVISKSNRYNREDNLDYEVAVIGVPNVGKSTFINVVRQMHTNKKRKALQTGALAGVTKSVSGKIRANFDPSVFLMDTPGILTPKVGDVEEGMKLALCGCLPDKIVGENLIVDFMLYILNKQGNFSYVQYFKLENPTDDVNFFLLHIAKEQKMAKRIKSIATNSFQYVPDLSRAAVYAIKQFRVGNLGKFMLDTI